MKFSFAMPNTVRVKALTQPFELDVTGADQIVMAKRAEELGYDMIPIPEHFIVPNAHVELSGPHYFHSTVAQAFIAGATQRIRVNSCVTLLPLQHPVIMAKALSTADWMSGGRITVTFGVGWDAEEFKILGVPFRERGRMADEYLASIVELWTSDWPEFHGKYVSFKDVAFEPKPVQKPHLPIWIGGDAEPMLKRAARYASGWFPWLTSPADIPAKLDFIKSQPTYDGRPFEVLYGLGSSRVGEGHVVIDDPTQLPGMSAEEIIDQLGWFAELGVTMTGVPIPPVKDINAYLDYAQWVIEEIKPKVP
ncbi:MULTISPECIES: TIGR03619 family F420-dependent LLM class oxidoreductase [Mycobacterium]|uniref:TIGR03619 family F420-dependent LLM class oxidoreductase n=1 Tax=Mycobacterium TaxID=1763 RepID=UPI001CDA2219|nr:MULTISPECIES: TIGR03619 family F420-dependent LLM class oxidoreductase [Mycobacterium]MCA2245300.1 TIGR03619 family F420-dependent LLM class oxidoreductase [Mycobacterium sp. WUMAC-067]MCA2316905.1 TIGR03619 family F420-dependent LLM class oxidoreductase [Mycobacterium sp. WUMAC-025]MEE3754857.1 TIGR03619 family F420-dependent LLM class oxidoreductase [Mycobacterium intracellulare]